MESHEIWDLSVIVVIISQVEVGGEVGGWVGLIHGMGAVAGVCWEMLG